MRCVEHTDDVELMNCVSVCLVTYVELTDDVEQKNDSLVGHSNVLYRILCDAWSIQMIDVELTNCVSSGICGAHRRCGAE